MELNELKKRETVTLLAAHHYNQDHDHTGYIKQVADYTDAERHQLIYGSEALVERGLLNRVKDGNRTRLELTERGKSVAERLSEIYERIEDVSA